jgi:ATP-dependent Lon protease
MPKYLKQGALALPVDLVDKLRREKLQQKIDEADRASADAEMMNARAEAKWLSKVAREKILSDAELAEDFEFQVEDTECYAGPTHQLFEIADLHAYGKSFKTMIVDEAHKSRTDAAIKAMLARGQHRKLKTLTFGFREKLKAMKVKFPNFAEVVEFIAGACEIAYRTDGVLQLTPMLLSGPPGTGKSMFCDALADFLDSGSIAIRFESAQSGSDLGGSSNFWSNSQPGKLFTLMTQTNDYSNPLVVLDEIDKVTASQYDPIGPLYTLLEPGTARRFQDQCYPVKLDFSPIRYIATCNDVSKIPEPLLSRFRPFEIEVASEQSKQIAKSIAHDVLSEIEKIDIAIAPDVFDQLESMAPRKIKQILLEAIGSALKENRDVVLAKDLNVKAKTKRIGFV